MLFFIIIIIFFYILYDENEYFIEYVLCVKDTKFLGIFIDVCEVW